MIRNIKILLALAVALWGIMGGLGNLASYEHGAATVETVMSMKTLPPEVLPDGPGEPAPLLVALGFAFIWVLKLVGGALCLVGTFRMWIARKAESEIFSDAKRWAIAGCGVILFMLFFGFSLVAVGPFKLYLSPMISSVELAALFAGQIGLVMVFLNQRDN